MRLRTWFAATLAALALIAAPSVARSQDEEPAWRAEYDRLLDRFSDVTGNRIELATGLLEKSVGEHPDDASARLELARLRAARDDYDQAILEANKVIARSKELEARAEALRCLAAYYGGRLRVERAPEDQHARVEEEFTKAFRVTQQKLAAAAGSADEADALFLSEQARYVRLRELAVVGRPAPALSKPDLQGKVVDLFDHRGQVVLVLFWRSTGKASLDALPELAKLVKTYEAKGLVAIGVASDERRADLEKTVAKHSIAWRQVHDPKSELATAWRLPAPEPTVCLVDHEGTIRFAARPTPEGLALTLDKLLERAASSRKKG